MDYSPPLTTDEWYTRGHLPRVHLWAPPPAGALIALEEIAQSKLKRPFEVTHVFVCPRLLYFEEWRRRFNKEMDVWLLIDPVSSLWPHQSCEPLVFGISFPLRSRKPWKLRRIPQVVDLGRELQEMFKDGSIYFVQILARPVAVFRTVKGCGAGSVLFPTCLIQQKLQNQSTLMGNH